MKRLTAAIALALALAGCSASEQTSVPSAPEPQAPVAEALAQPEAPAEPQGTDEGKDLAMQLSIDGTQVNVAWESNQAVSELAALAADSPLTVDLSMYGGFEQVGPLGTSLTASDEQVTTAAGDIVLYAGNQISIFYNPNSWSYTRLGHITDKSADELVDLLGNGNVSITISAS